MAYGDLTIRGVTKPVSFNAPIPGGVMISEKVAIDIEAELVLRKE